MGGLGVRGGEGIFDIWSWKIKSTYNIYIYRKELSFVLLELFMQLKIGCLQYLEVSENAQSWGKEVSFLA